MLILIPSQDVLEKQTANYSALMIFFCSLSSIAHKLLLLFFLRIQSGGGYVKFMYKYASQIAGYGVITSNFPALYMMHAGDHDETFVWRHMHMTS